ncbi:hypothetical protein ACOSQ3_004571 [Xanthoceras sorbifolium]
MWQNSTSPTYSKIIPYKCEGDSLDTTNLTPRLVTCPPNTCPTQIGYSGRVVICISVSDLTGREAVSWKSVKQSLTTSSTMEAEYPLKIYCDNSAAVVFSCNTRNSSRSKHIDIKHLFVREKVVESIICVEHIPTGLMLADPLTKDLVSRVFQEHVTRMGLIESSIVFS